MQFRVFAAHNGQKSGLLDPCPAASVRALHVLFCRAIIRNALHGRFFGLDQAIFDKSGRDSANQVVFANALRNVRLRSESLVVIGHALVAHAELAIGFVDNREHGRHAAHDALRPNHRRFRQIRGIPNVHDFHSGHGNAAEQVNAVAAGALQEPARFIQQRIQTLAQHVIGRIVVRVSVLQRLAKMRLNVHVGIRVKFAHHFTREPVNPVFHVGCHPPAFSDLAVKTHNFGFGQRGNPIPVFRNAGRIHAIHFLPLALRVVFDERRLLRAVQHFEQVVQRHRKPRNRPHDEVH